MSTLGVTLEYFYNSRSRNSMPASKPIRRGQLISPFGVGAMVDFPKDESLMPTGIDAWQWAKEACPPDSGWLVREERLEARLSRLGRPITHFRLPPDFREQDMGGKFAGLTVPFIRFPLWHYCHQCGGMELLSGFSSTRQKCSGRPYEKKTCSTKPPNRRPFLIPVRFIAVCDFGHIQDFPFKEWLHRDKPASSDCKIRMRAGRSSAGLSGITIECSCSAKRTLGDVFRFDENAGGPLSKIGCMCKGLRPWLGETENAAAHCGRHLRVLQRGASNVYFPQILSAIYLPLWAGQVSGEITDVLEQPNFWSQIQQRTEGGKVMTEICDIIAGITGVDSKRLKLAAERKLQFGSAIRSSEHLGDEENFRYSEYQAICDGKVGPQTELFVECVELSKYEGFLANYFSRVRLVHKLRETRALIGFTRILPPDGTLTSDRLQVLKLDSQIDWLPAIKVYGEGIFFELSPKAISEWEVKVAKLRPDIAALIKNYNSARALRQQPYRNVGARFLLLHTLAHLLINQLSFDCGYGSASLRERLYCDINEPKQPMNGILIYTASGDSEGSMGGLVRQGQPGRLETTLKRALSRASWCSSDPVCIESKGQGSDSANLAACHGCCLLPETSCEEGNRLLDRALLIGTPSKPDLGFFADLLNA